MQEFPDDQRASVTLRAAPISTLWRGTSQQAAAALPWQKRQWTCVCFAPRVWLTNPAHGASHLQCTLSTLLLTQAEGGSSTEGFAASSASLPSICCTQSSGSSHRGGCEV